MRLRICPVIILLLVFALGILALFTSFRVVGKAGKKAQRNSCQANLFGIYTQLKFYAGDHGGWYPSRWSDLEIGGERSEIFICPADYSAPGPMDEIDLWSSYRLVPGLSQGHRGDLILAYDKPGNHSGGSNVLLVNGTIKWMRHDQLSGRLSRQNRILQKENGASD